MGITGTAIKISQEIYIAFKHLLSLKRNLVHHYRSVDHLLRNIFPSPECVFVAKIASERIRKVVYVLHDHFPNLNKVEGPQYLKQWKTVVTIIC